MNSFIENFHFLRPWFLLALPLGLLFIFALRHSLGGQSNWKNVIDPQLLGYLIEQPQQQAKRQWPLASLLIAWIIACLAMAGPAWERRPQPVSKNQNAYILLLDLSLSMYAEDQKPSRLTNAKRKIADILTARKDGLTALVAYSGDAHVVAPVTDDSETIATLLPALEPGMMPKFGSNLASAISEAEKLLQKSGAQKSELVLFTDEISPSQFALLEGLAAKKLHLSIFTFGTETGAPIPLESGFLKDRSGSTVIARLNWDEISDFASSNNLLAVQSSFDDQDIRLLLGREVADDQHQASERQFDLWQDYGHWLTLLLLPLLLTSFRRGWILLVFIMVLPDNSYAMGWDDLWQTKDQQAAAAFNNGDTKTAAEIFENPLWKASAEYKNGNYAEALKGFAKDNSATGLYNQGNALARAGQLEEAIKAYDEALKKQPGMADAASNKALVEKLQEQQKQQQDQSKEQQDKQDKQEKQEKQDSGQQNAEQQDSSSDNAQQQDSQQQDSQQKNSEQQNQQQQSSAEQQQGQQEQSPANNDEKKPDNSDQQQTTAEKTDKQPDQEQQAAEQQALKEEQQNEGDKKTQAQQAAAMTPLEKEQQQALQQWLRKIPDDPGQLLRNKFRYQYENNRRNNEHIDKDSEQLW